MRFFIAFLFYFPLIATLLNVQIYISTFISPSIAQILAYLNVLLLFLGMALIIPKKKQTLNPILKLWLLFYLLYYAFAVTADISLGKEGQFLKSLIPIIFFLSFCLFLNNTKEIIRVSKVLAFSFLISSVFVIVMQYFNFSLDYDGVSEYAIDRAGGVYGDANNASLSSIMAFIFLKLAINPKSRTGKIMKASAMFITVYAIILTFSKTGFLVFFIVLCLLYHKLFSFKKIIFTIIFLPISIYTLFNWALDSPYLSQVQKNRVNDLINIATLNTEKVGLSERDVLLENMMQHVYERPFLGNGINFSNLIRGHNTIIGIWADAGFLVFLIFLFILIAYIKKSIQPLDEFSYYSLAMLCTLILFMLSLQTVINQEYLMVVFVLLSYILYSKNRLIIKTQK